MAAQTHAVSDLDRVDGEQTDAVARDAAFHRSGQVSIELLGCPTSVQKERAARLHLLHHVVLAHIALIVASDEVGALHIIRAADGFFRQAQVRLGHAEGLLGVVLEIRLREQVGAVAQDADSVVVGAHRAVAA